MFNLLNAKKCVQIDPYILAYHPSKISKLPPIARLETSRYGPPRRPKFNTHNVWIPPLSDQETVRDIRNRLGLIGLEDVVKCMNHWLIIHWI